MHVVSYVSIKDEISLRLFFYTYRVFLFSVLTTCRVLRVSIPQIVFTEPLALSEQIRMECSCFLFLHKGPETSTGATELSMVLSFP